jgi:hypothetical protein
MFALCLLMVDFTCADDEDAPNANDAALLQEAPLSPDDRDHWSFRPLQRPQLPSVSDRSWPRTPIDLFVLSKLEAADIRPAVEADRATLIRRLSFDLVGLPPPPEEIDRFLSDKAPNAYERLVDRLLASPHYGERWGQHWLDLARFAETDGFEHDKIRPTAWKYRDWVIRALNSDLPYDQFVRWQIAGDLLDPGNHDARTATAFCLSGPDMPDINSQEERRHTLLNEITATVASVFLGLQMGCAQCHDHKYDPISQADFFRLRSFFTPAVRVSKGKSIAMLANRSSGETVSHLMIRGDWRRPGPRVEPAFPRIADPWQTSAVARQSNLSRAQLANWLTRVDHPLSTRVIVNRVWQYHFGRGLSRTPSDFGVMGESPSHPRLLDWLASEFASSGWQLKRLQRMIVTSAVFRQRSQPVTDPAHVNREPSGNRQELARELFASFPRRRLEAEVVRDAMLSAGDSLLGKMGGPGVMPPLPKELAITLLKNQWKTSPHSADHFRRSIYVFARRNLRYPIFEAFDRPASNASCPRRQNSTTALQSLLMLNSEQSVDAARRFASLVWDRGGDLPEEQVDFAVRRVWSRAPTDEERSEFVAFLDNQRVFLAAEKRSPRSLALPISARGIADPFAAAALTDLCLALLNSSEFLYVD